MKVRKKPVEVEAIQWTGVNKAEMVEFLKDDIYVYNSSFDVRTLEGFLTVRPTDFVIKGIKGEHYPCRSDIFAETYEVVEP